MQRRKRRSKRERERERAEKERNIIFNVVVKDTSLVMENPKKMILLKMNEKLTITVYK